MTYQVKLSSNNIDVQENVNTLITIKNIDTGRVQNSYKKLSMEHYESLKDKLNEIENGYELLSIILLENT